jgi:hypothetical protein
MWRKRLLPAPLGVLLGLSGLFLVVPALRAHVLPSVGPAASPGFTQSHAGSPVVWPPCARIDVLVNPGPGGDVAFGEIVGALDEVAFLTGLRFSPVRSAAVPRYDWALSGPGTPPVVIGWVYRDQTDLLDGSPAATVANPRTSGVDKALVTGAIAFDAAQFGDFAAGSGPGLTRRNLILHELGHLLGLDHGPGLMAAVLDGATPDGFTEAEFAALAGVYHGC